jgi:hypothetical protein
MSTHPRLGFRQLPNPKDDHFRLSKIMSSTTVKHLSKTWRRGDTLDQKETNACVGFSSFQFQVSEPFIKSPKLSPEEIYWEARNNDEFPGNADEGTSIRAGLEVLRRHGVIHNYYWAESAEQALDYLIRFGPLLFGTLWTMDMFAPDEGGCIRPTGEVVGGHAWFAHAGRWNSLTGAGRITGLTSWGESFGYNGEFEISLTDIDELFKRGGVAAAVIEQ